MTSVTQNLQSPFVQLADLLNGIAPGDAPIDLTIGEPKHPVPDFVGPVLQANLGDFNRYPPIRGTVAFRNAVADWAERRFKCGNILDRQHGILPLNGSREGLFFAALFSGMSESDALGKSKILIPNPYYPVYAAGALAAGMTPIAIDCPADNNYLPSLASINAQDLAEAAAVFLASPANPQGGVADAAYWNQWIDASWQHDFLLFADECYSEIYRKAPPVGVLQIASDRQRCRNIIAFNSLSKRSNLAGLRCGFAIGDPERLKYWATFRNMAGPQVPLPIQAVAIAALGDEGHVEENRRLYNEKYSDASVILAERFAPTVPEGGFFLWLDIRQFGTAQDIARDLWQAHGVKVIPGSFLCAEDGNGRNEGEGFIRIAMVESREKTAAALRRLAEF